MFLLEPNQVRKDLVARGAPSGPKLDDQGAPCADEIREGHRGSVEGAYLKVMGEDVRESRNRCLIGWRRRHEEDAGRRKTSCSKRFVLHGYTPIVSLSHICVNTLKRRAILSSNNALALSALLDPTSGSSTPK
jgi:hypothetical protein